MKRKALFGITLTLLLTSMLTLASNIQSAEARPTTWTVDDDGPADFARIQDAINAAGDGDTIFVHSGIYYENVVFNKTVLLIGENRSTTIIDSAGKGTVVSVTANNVIISEFTIENGGSYGILLDYSHGNTISENIIKNNYYYGIRIWYSGYNTLRNNVLTKNGYNFLVYGTSISDFVQDIDVSNKVDGKAVYYWVNQHNRQVPADAGYVSVVNSTNISVKNLNLTNNADGVQLAYTTCSTIENVTASDNFVGVHLIYSSSNLLIENNIVSNDGIGIRLYHSSDNTVLANTIKNNANGIISWYSGSNEFSGNTISNRWVGIGLRYSDNNTIFHNNFINNTEQVSLKESLCNTWDDGYPSGGNYWSDYTGIDEKSGLNQDLPGSDGIGDTPYTIDVNNQDRYPLMEPWSIPTMIRTLIRTVRFWDLPKGTENSLTSKLDDAIHLLDAGNENGAVHKLMDFIDQVETLREKKLTNVQADHLISEAQRIIDPIKG